MDWINDASKPLCLVSLRGRRADGGGGGGRRGRRVAGLRRPARGEHAAGTPISVRRAEHRREHLDEIDRILARG